MKQSLCDPYPLAHTQRVGFHLMVDAVGHLDQLYDTVDVFLVDAIMHGCKVLQVFPSCHPLVKIGILHDAAYIFHSIFKIPGDIVAANADVSLGDMKEPQDQLDGSGFTCTVGAEKPHNFPGIYRQGYAVQDLFLFDCFRQIFNS
jgi:hypothetical protein